MIHEFERIVIDRLIADNHIPDEGIFQITEAMLTKYIRCYGYLNGQKNGGLKRRNESRFAPRLAGLTLLKVNFARGATVKSVNAGQVYMIENPSYPLHYKMGMTLELNDRLASYQTYDPYRGFNVVKYDCVLDRRDVERQLLAHPDILREQGEWVLKENAISIFERICFDKSIPR